MADSTETKGIRKVIGARPSSTAGFWLLAAMVYWSLISSTTLHIFLIDQNTISPDRYLRTEFIHEVTEDPEKRQHLEGVVAGDSAVV